MEDYKQRVITEGEELKTKMEALARFMLTEKFDELPYYERQLLKEQLSCMIRYLNIITKRIKYFEEQKYLY